METRGILFCWLQQKLWNIWMKSDWEGGEAGERFSVTWHHMGQEEMKMGNHPCKFQWGNTDSKPTSGWLMSHTGQSSCQICNGVIKPPKKSPCFTQTICWKRKQKLKKRLSRKKKHTHKRALSCYGVHHRLMGKGDSDWMMVQQATLPSHSSEFDH